MVRTLRFKRYTTGNLSVGPDLALERLNGEDFILEEHEVLLNSFSDALVLSC